jgi:hypothetical protein
LIHTDKKLKNDNHKIYLSCNGNDLLFIIMTCFFLTPKN